MARRELEVVVNSNGPSQISQWVSSDEMDKEVAIRQYQRCVPFFTCNIMDGGIPRK